MSGWIKLHRSLLEWEWYDDANATRLLVHLLISVNYEPKKWKGTLIKAGSMAYSWETLSLSCGLTIQQTRTAMKKLISSGEVTNKATNKYQVVTLCKWEKLQSDNKQITSNLTDKQQTNNKQITTTKESKENKEVKKQEIERERKRFYPPSIEEVEDYFFEKNCQQYKQEASKFWYHYDANGWKVGKNKMKNWKSAASGWLTRIDNFKPKENGTTKNNGESIEDYHSRIRNSLES